MYQGMGCIQIYISRYGLDLALYLKIWVVMGCAKLYISRYGLCLALYLKIWFVLSFISQDMGCA